MPGTKSEDLTAVLTNDKHLFFQDPQCAPQLLGVQPQDLCQVVFLHPLPPNHIPNYQSTFLRVENIS
jgi:hypothetical protein